MFASCRLATFRARTALTRPQPRLRNHPQVSKAAVAPFGYSADNLDSVVVGSLAEDFPNRFDLGRLNNGSFGGTPEPVHAYQRKWKQSWDAYVVASRLYFHQK